MDLKQLEYFRHVAELGSFTRASTFLSVVQPALSRQVRQLEVELGQNLFERNGRGVILTDAGSRLLEHTRGILTQVGRAREELEEQRNGDSGHFTLGLPPSLGRSMTVPLVKAFGHSLPNVGLATVEGLSVYMLEWLNIGRVDCALVYNAPASPNLDLQPLLDEQLFLVGPQNAKGTRKSRKAITLAELADHPLVIPSRPHALRMSVENALAGISKKILVAHEIESIPAVIDLVRQGYGYAVLPLNAVKSTEWANQVEVRPVVSPTLKTSLSIATSTQRPRSSLMRKAILVIRDIVRQQLRSAEVVT
ncbi:MAG: LysR family transcriptional regulator, nitrogen assimilation regulatory protein [Gammaproteobacteria bacterium]|jgi:LysR family nitrogen assimilation transcriptional regulator|nr:LysR family transcriptional regulator, nitrogen assimilation regulatory protein [Gammaproteobacteria bacterium]